MLQQVTDLGEEFLALGRCDWCRCLGAAQGIDHFDESKDAGADDDELDDRVDEASVADNRRVLLGFNNCLVMLAIERMMTPMARSTTFPRLMNSLNSVRIFEEEATTALAVFCSGSMR